MRIREVRMGFVPEVGMPHLWAMSLRAESLRVEGSRDPMHCCREELRLGDRVSGI
jgi:hypothetical protein